MGKKATESLIGNGTKALRGAPKKKPAAHKGSTDTENMEEEIVVTSLFATAPKGWVPAIPISNLINHPVFFQPVLVENLVLYQWYYIFSQLPVSDPPASHGLLTRLVTLNSSGTRFHHVRNPDRPSGGEEVEVVTFSSYGPDVRDILFFAFLGVDVPLLSHLTTVETRSKVGGSKKSVSEWSSSRHKKGTIRTKPITVHLAPVDSEVEEEEFSVGSDPVVSFALAPGGLPPALPFSTLTNPSNRFQLISFDNLTLNHWYYLLFEFVDNGTSSKFGYLSLLVGLSSGGTRFQHVRNSHVVSGGAEVDEVPFSDYGPGFRELVVFGLPGVPPPVVPPSPLVEPPPSFPFKGPGISLCRPPYPPESPPLPLFPLR